MAEDEAAPSNKSQRALDWVNFFIADVETAFGPFIAVYLIANGWSQGMIGLLLTIGGVASILSQLPGGAIVDAAPNKRLLAQDFGYTIGFFTLAAIAACGFAVIFFFMPETMPSEFRPVSADRKR